jgi:hypothetical protein
LLNYLIASLQSRNLFFLFLFFDKVFEFRSTIPEDYKLPSQIHKVKIYLCPVIKGLQKGLSKWLYMIQERLLWPIQVYCTCRNHMKLGQRSELCIGINLRRHIDIVHHNPKWLSEKPCLNPLIGGSKFKSMIKIVEEIRSTGH